MRREFADELFKIMSKDENVYLIVGDVVITRLRQKIEPDPKNPIYLQTVRGNGYVLWAD